MSDEGKKLVGIELAKRLVSGEKIGIGSGSTVECAIGAIRERIRDEGLIISGVPTSKRTAELADAAGIQVLSPINAGKLSWAFDGADEIDYDLNMIKGGGACMLHEKIVARRSEKLVILITENKIVKNLGENFAVPVEIINVAEDLVSEQLHVLGAKEVVLRVDSGKSIVTDEGNVILDAHFDNITPELETKINSITGVVENGLFMNFSPEVLLAKDGRVDTFGGR